MIPALATLALSAALSVPSITGRYLDRYFATFPTAAVQAGRHDHDADLEDLSPLRLHAWLDFNRETLRMLSRLNPEAMSPDERLDAEALSREAARQIHDLEVRRRPERDPLFWSDIAGNATVFLLVREDRPLAERLGAVRARCDAMPRLAAQARSALAGTDPERIAPELARIAAGQTRASARFYREGIEKIAPSDRDLALAGRRAADALDALAGFLEELAVRATGSPRLGLDYAETFRLGTGIDEPLDEVLAGAERDLKAKRREAAEFGRGVWKEIFPGQPAPAADRELLSRLFARVAQDHATGVEDFVDDFRVQVRDVEKFLREKDIVTLPDPLTLWVGPSPGFFVGQSVGGVYPAGPYEPGAKTLFFLPTPPDGATPEQKGAFYRDFNHHFNVMITPHEILPGHYLQLKYAALNPHKVRTLFADGVFVEGWGTFCERLMLDEGWGGPLDRLAHMKKQMENIARTIVDIRVHTAGMTRSQVLDFVKREALQDDQFASNMWTRSITSAPQLTFYYLGNREVRGLYDDVKRARGASFRLKDFLDGMMALGPVPVRHYRQRMLGASATPRASAPEAAPR
jgi:hypothetical protein